MKKQKPSDIAQKQRHLHLLSKVKSGQTLRPREIAELGQLEVNSDVPEETIDLLNGLTRGTADALHELARLRSWRKGRPLMSPADKALLEANIINAEQILLKAFASVVDRLNDPHDETEE